MNPQYVPPQQHVAMNNSVGGYGAPPGAPNYAMPPAGGGIHPQGGMMPPQASNFPMRPPMSGPMGGPMPGNMPLSNSNVPHPMGGLNSNMQSGPGPAMGSPIMPPMGPSKMMSSPNAPQGGPMGPHSGRMPGPPLPGSPRAPTDHAAAYQNGAMTKREISQSIQGQGPPGRNPLAPQGPMPPTSQGLPGGPMSGPSPVPQIGQHMANMNLGPQQPGQGFGGNDFMQKPPTSAPPTLNGTPDAAFQPPGNPMYMNGSRQMPPPMRGMPPQPQSQLPPPGPLTPAIISGQVPHLPPGAVPPSALMHHPQVMHPPSGMPPMPQHGTMPPQQQQPLGQMPPFPGQQPHLAQPKPGYPLQGGRLPPQPPQQDMYATHQGHQQAPYPNQQAQQSRRLDPDQMPSPIQVMQEDQRQRCAVFCTNQRGLVPPLVTTNFVTQDEGNCSPRFMRASMYSVPATIDMMKQTAVPFGLVISPLAETLAEELPPPIVNMGEMGPVRCIRCKAYMCPMMQFVDGGRRFHCLLCKATSEVPPEYFQHLDHTGQRVDRFERPELMLGTYEFVATKEYCRNNTFPKPPALIFLIDVSYNNIKSGMVSLLCHEMRGVIANLPRDEGCAKSNMRVGFITYSNAVHFYNIKGTLAQPKMMVVGDIQDVFMPLLDGFLCEPEEAGEMIDSLMEQIPAMFAESRDTETLLAPAIQAGLEALKASECAGKLLVFHSSLPIAEAPGKLKNRDDRKLLGTDKEKTVLCPQNTFYNNLGQDCVAAGCSVDLFIFNNSYIDVATIGQVARLTGGQIYKYTYFQADIDGPRLIADITRNVSRNVAFDSIMRVRTSTGVRPTDFYGHFFMSNTTDMELASIDSDKAIAIEVKHDDKLTEEEGVFIQVALLYTSCGGQRRLRILNLALKTCVQMADLYRGCDLDTIVNFFAKQSVVKILEHSPKPVKDALVNRCAQMLACYRKNCASPSSAGQLILPECMKLLPLYVNCILKSDAISGGSDMSLDDRSFIMSVVSTMDIPSSVVLFYPRLLPVHDVDLNSETLPPPIRCSSDKLRDDGVYLLDNGIHMFLWVGSSVAMEWTHSVFGDHLAAKIDIDRTALPNLENPISQRLRQIIETVRSQRPRSMKMTIIPQRDKLEVVFKHFLVEDRGIDGSSSYVDFLCHMHKEIRNLLS